MFAKNSKNWRVFVGETDITEGVNNVRLDTAVDSVASDEAFVPMHSGEITMSVPASFQDDVQPLIDLVKGVQLFVTVEYSDGTWERVEIKHLEYVGEGKDIAMLVYLSHMPYGVAVRGAKLRGLPVIFRVWGE